MLYYINVSLFNPLIVELCGLFNNENISLAIEANNLQTI